MEYPSDGYRKNRFPRGPSWRRRAATNETRPASRGQGARVAFCSIGLACKFGETPALRAAILRPRFSPGKSPILKVESEFGRISSRRDEVGSAKRRQEVIQCDFIGEVDDSESQAPPVIVFGAEQVVVPQTHVKQVAGSDTRRIVIIVGRSWRGYPDARRAVLGSGATRER